MYAVSVVKTKQNVFRRFHAVIVVVVVVVAAAAVALVVVVVAVVFEWSGSCNLFANCLVLPIVIVVDLFCFCKDMFLKSLFGRSREIAVST